MANWRVGEPVGRKRSEDETRRDKTRQRGSCLWHTRRGSSSIEVRRRFTTGRASKKERAEGELNPRWLRNGYLAL